jgi:hypothetical protein
VGEYTHRSLTFLGDKLIALSAIATRLAKVWNYTYVAGLWKETLPHDLSWYCCGNLQDRPQEYIAPSFSWASIKGKVNFVNTKYYDETYMYLFNIVSSTIHTHLEDIYQTGQVFDGTLTLRGKLIKTHWPHSIRNRGAVRMIDVFHDDICRDWSRNRCSYWPNAVTSLDVTSPPAYFIPLLISPASDKVFLHGLIVVERAAPDVGMFERIGLHYLSHSRYEKDHVQDLREFGEGAAEREIVLK